MIGDDLINLLKMRNFIFVLLIGLCSLSSYAWNDLDRDIIELDETYINNNQATLKEKAVTIFGKSYTVYVGKVKLSPTWFTAQIVIKPESNSDDLQLTNHVVQSCAIEDEIPDTHGYTSECDVTLYQNYDFMIVSKVHLLKQQSNFGDVTVSYTIYDYGKDNTFTLDLVFPYMPNTITAIDEMSIENNSAIEYYDLQGRKLNGPQPGIVIEKQGNKVTKKMYR